MQRLHRPIVLVLLAALVMAASGPRQAAHAFGLDLIPIDAKAEQRLAVEVDKYMHAHHKFSSRPDLVMRLQYLGQRLAAVSGSKIHWHFQIVNEPYKNMESSCCGYVYAYKGIFDCSFDNDQLAGILGHEMTHILKQHVAKFYALKYGSLKFDDIVVDKTVADMKMYRNGPAGPYMLYTYAQRKLCRDFEREADAGGVRITYKAGFDPEGHARALKVLLKDDNKKMPLKQALLLTHPPSRERIERIHLEAVKVRAMGGR